MKALVVAGGMPQITLIKQLRERGVETVLIDGSPTPVALPYPDVFYNVNVFDTDAVRNIAVKENVDFLITVCADQVLLVVAQISEELGLPCYIDYATAKLVSDKHLMKQIFIKHGIPTSKYIVMDDFDAEKTRDLHYPLIVKPVDAYSSKGVNKVFSESDLEAAFDKAMTVSRNKKKIIVEEFFEGEEISVDLFVEDGKAHVLCVTNSEKVKDNEHFAIFRGRYPSHATDRIKKKIEKVCQDIVDAFKIKNAPMLVQMLTDGNRVTVLEFSARTGGAMKWLLIKHITGIDVISCAIDLTMGIKPDITIREPETKYIVNDFIYCKPGVFDHLEGFDEQIGKGNITDYRVLRPKGWSFSGVVASSTDRICGVTFQDDTLEGLNRKHRAFVDAVRVVDRHGRDIMRHDLLPDLSE